MVILGQTILPFFNPSTYSRGDLRLVKPAAHSSFSPATLGRLEILLLWVEGPTSSRRKENEMFTEDTIYLVDPFDDMNEEEATEVDTLFNTQRKCWDVYDGWKESIASHLNRRPCMEVAGCW